MRRLLPKMLPPGFALLGFIFVVVIEKSHRVFQPCPSGIARAVVHCGGTASGPLEPRSLLLGVLAAAALGAWTELVLAQGRLWLVTATLALSLSVASYGVRGWANSVNQPRLERGTVEPATTTTITPSHSGEGDNAGSPAWAA